MIIMPATGGGGVLGLTSLYMTKMISDSHRMMTMKFIFNVAAISWMMSDSRLYGLSTSLQRARPNV